jgi:hypothetical protein
VCGARRLETAAWAPKASASIVALETTALDEHQLRRAHRCRPLQSAAKQPSRDESGALLRLVLLISAVAVGGDFCFDEPA